MLELEVSDSVVSEMVVESSGAEVSNVFTGIPLAVGALIAGCWGIGW